MITATDTFAYKYKIRRNGDGYPAEGAAGLAFPYIRPSKKKFSSSAAFRRGLAHDAAPNETKPDKAWRNGFATFHSMDAAHAPLVRQAIRAVPRPGGRVIDLGCGDGALLLKILGETAGVEPFGIDRSAAAIAIARQLMPTFVTNFQVGDLWTRESILTQRYSLAIFALRRLDEVTHDFASNYVTRLRASASKVLVYSYDVGAKSLDHYASSYGLWSDPPK